MRALWRFADGGTKHPLHRHTPADRTIAVAIPNRPKPAPEYQLGWKDREAARRSLERILAWDFDRVVVAHGAPIEDRPHEALRAAWRPPLPG